jgi:phage/plasmid-associated DNA primase
MSMEGGTPTDVENLLEAKLTSTSVSRAKREARVLADAFKRYEEYQTGNKDPNTNFIDRISGKTYNLPPNVADELLGLLNDCRRAGITNHIAERQFSSSITSSGIMFDADVYVDNINPDCPDFTTREYTRIGTRIASIATEVLLFDSLTADASASPSITTPLFFIAKPNQPERVTKAEAKYKFGWHCIMPGLHVTKNAKREMNAKAEKDATIQSVFSKIGAVDASKCIDQASSGVPVFQFGSCKPNATPYVLVAAFNVVLEFQHGCAPELIPLNVAEIEKKYNLTAELSLTHTASYRDGTVPLVTAYRVASSCDPSADEIVPADDFPDMMGPSSISTLAVCDAQARHLHKLLDILPPSYYTDYDKWRNVIYALAGTSADYYALAEWFSKKSEDKYDESALKQLWSTAATAEQTDRCYTSRSIMYWAKQEDPDEFRKCSMKSYFMTLANEVYNYDGKIKEFCLAEMLSQMLEMKFVTDGDPTIMRSREGLTWYEFVMPKDPQMPGQVYKWRNEGQAPDCLSIYISRQLAPVFDNIRDSIEEQRQRHEDDEALGKYYAGVQKAFKESRAKTQESAFKRNVIHEASLLFRKRGFLKSLDQTPYLIGVKNGILRLPTRDKPEPQVIQEYHEYPITKSTRVEYVPFDPQNPSKWHKIVLDALSSTIPEPDARERIIMHWATGVYGGYKDAQTIVLHGGGSNGKTFLLTSVNNALGDDYATKLKMQLLSGGREDAEKPNSAFMRLKDRRCGFFDESAKGQMMNIPRLKELVNPSTASGRDLNGKEENIKMIATLSMATNYPLTMHGMTDDGTWRRLLYYTFKIKFCRDPDPEKPFERKKNGDYARDFVEREEYLEAFFSILIYFYQRLIVEYDGKAEDVPCPTIDRETNEFRTSQDTVHRFVCECIVIPKEPNECDNAEEVAAAAAIDCKSEEYRNLLHSVAHTYGDWHNNIIGGCRYKMHEIADEIQQSALVKYLRRSANGTIYYEGFRVIGITEEPRLGERYMGARRLVADDSYLRFLNTGDKKWWMPHTADHWLYDPDCAELRRRSGIVDKPLPKTSGKKAGCKAAREAAREATSEGAGAGVAAAAAKHYNDFELV